LPIKTFQSFEVDPLAAITATLAKFGEEEEAWLQLTIRPATEKWQQKNERYLAGLKGGHSLSGNGLLKALWAPPEAKAAPSPKLTEYDQLRAKGAELKGEKLAFEAVLRLVYRGNVTQEQARLRLQSIASSYKQFNTTYLNGFTQGRVTAGQDLPAYRATRIRAVICVPLHTGGKFTAAMAVHQATSRHWTPQEVELVQMVVRRCWESLERARSLRSLGQSEERLRFMAESMPQKIFTAKPDGSVDYYNPQFLGFTGYTLAEVSG
jgi:PAS domain-containing protein